MTRIPPLLEEVPAGSSTCTRRISATDVNCSRPATRHLLWNEDETGLACDEHWTEIQQRWACRDSHPFGGVCTVPGSAWYLSWEQPTGEGFCAFPDDDGFPITAEAEAEAERQAVGV